MNIGINLFSLNPAYAGGINSYTLGLTQGFASTGAEHKFQLYVTKRNKHLFDKYTSLKNFNIIEISDTAVKKAFRIGAFATLSQNIYKTACDILYSENCRIMEEGSDLIYTPTTYLFPYNIKKTTLVSVHDLQQFHFPQFFSKAELFNRKIHYGLSAKLTDYMQASSQFIKNDLLLQYKNIKEKQIVVISEGVNVELFSQGKDTSYLCNKYSIPEDFILFPAQAWHHKNHITLLKSLNAIRNNYKQKIPLVLTGKTAAASQNISKYLTENGLDFVYQLGLVPFDDLRALYKKARFLVNPSLFESSSLPILEAAASGTAVIASDIPPNIEMGKKLKLNLYEALNFKELADLIFTLWKDDAQIKEQARLNSENISIYSWNNVAKQYLQFMQSVV
jgi:glycosyltransferase involved in cell wall biosynthesis